MKSNWESELPRYSRSAGLRRPSRDRDSSISAPEWENTSPSSRLSRHQSSAVAKVWKNHKSFQWKNLSVIFTLKLKAISPRDNTLPQPESGSQKTLYPIVLDLVPLKNYLLFQAAVKQQVGTRISRIGANTVVFCSKSNNLLKDQWLPIASVMTAQMNFLQKTSESRKRGPATTPSLSLKKNNPQWYSRPTKSESRSRETLSSKPR